MTFTQAVQSCFIKYATFSGRASRSEFWYFILFSFLAGMLVTSVGELFFFAGEAGTLRVSWLLSLVLFVPQISVGVRRLHDIDYAGWWWWLGLILFVGWVVLLVLYTFKGTVGANKYGPDPLEGVSGDGGDTGPYSRSSIPKVRRHK